MRSICILLGLLLHTSLCKGTGRVSTSRQAQPEGYLNSQLPSHSESTPEVIEDVRNSLPVPIATEHKIPKILHYIFLSGYDAYIAETQKPNTSLHTWYRDTCLSVNSHWEHMFWTEDMAVDLLSTHYSWFLPTYWSYEMEVMRSDVIRPFILLHYGGLYLDLDNECYTPAEAAFGEYDVVLQGSASEGVNNGMMASAPQHPLWHELLNVFADLRDEVKDAPWLNHPLALTGPSTLSKAIQRFLKLRWPASGWLSRTFHVNGTKLHIYPIGEFFMPCWFKDLVCIAQYERSFAAGTRDMSKLVGRHWFAGIWNKPENFPGAVKE